MAVAVDYVNNAGSANNTGQTFSMTLAAGATLLIIGQGERVAPSAAPSWNGSSTGVTLAVSGTCSSGAAYLYYLANPTTGTHNVVTTNASGWNSPGAISFTGASTTITYTNSVTNGTSTTTPSSTCTSTTSSIVVDYINHNQGSALTATGSGQTKKWGTQTANGIAMSTTTGASTTTVSYSVAGANVWCMALLSVDVGASSSQVKSADSTVVASIKSWDGTTIAGVKSASSVANS